MNQYLKNLDAHGQIGVLFVFVFGLLLLVTVIAAIQSLRRSTQASTGAADEELGSDMALSHPYRALLKTSWMFALVFWLSWSLGDKVATVLFAFISFFALREFITLSPTKRGDHRSLLLVFFVVLPVQYALVMYEHFNLFTVFIPVYVFLAIPVVSALAGDPTAFLERNAKMQWGIMVCVFGLSHVPAILLLDFPLYNGGQSYAGKNMFLLFHLVMVVQLCMVIQHMSWRWFDQKTWGKNAQGSKWNRAVAPNVSKSFNWASWLLGISVASLVGGLLAGITPFIPAQAVAMSFIACVAGSFGHLVMKALKRDRGVTHWAGGAKSVTGAGGLLDRIDSLCFAAPVFFHSVHWYFNL
jgi:phosphatidate cytidylyltransferase